MTYETFLVGMMKASDSALARADIGKLAAKHGVPVGWAKMHLEAWRGRVRDGKA